MMEITRICPACYLLRVPDAGISWVFNAWPDLAKFLIQQELAIDGIVYPDLRMQSDQGISCNLVEFPLLHALFNQGMYFREERPCLVGTKRQLELATESLARGLFGFYNASEMEDCDLTPEEAASLMKEIEGLSFKGLQPIDEIVETVELSPLESVPTPETATDYRGLRIWKEGINLFGVEYEGERRIVDCNLLPGEEYEPPLRIDVKNVPYKLFQIIDTGEEDGFSPKSCMHTVIQWRERVICIDLPMNVPYLLDKVSISRSEIDAVIFTHNHDDHIGEFSMLLQMDKKVTIICPRVIWKSILLKAAAMFDTSIEELGEYFNYVPIRFDEEFDYCGLKITAHPSIHTVPCAVYQIRGVVDREWKVYGHMSDLLNFERCRSLIEDGFLSADRFEAYRDFVLRPMHVKKVDVGAREGTEAVSVHGSWKDFVDDKTEHIVLAHAQPESLDERATVKIGQFAVAGSARNMSERSEHTYGDKYRERALRYLADYFFALVDDRIAAGLVAREQVLSYMRMLADNEILLIQPRTPFLKATGQSSFVDMVIGGKGGVWIEQGDSVVRVAHVNAGEIIGDIGVLKQIPRTATIRADTYMHVLRIPGFMFREAVTALGAFSDRPPEGRMESALEKIWRLREIVQGSWLFGAEVPIYLQNKIAQKADPLPTNAGDAVFEDGNSKGDLFIASTSADVCMTVGGHVVPAELCHPPVFGEGCFLNGTPEAYRVESNGDRPLLKLPRHKFEWILDVPIFKLRLRELHARREEFVKRAQRHG